MHQKCLKQVEARSNNGDFETHTPWLRAVASLSEAERVIFVRTKALALTFSLQTLRDEIGAVHCQSRPARLWEELPQLITDKKFTTLASSFGFVCYTNSITMVLGQDKYVERSSKC